MINNYQNVLLKLIIDILGAFEENKYGVSESVFNSWIEKRKKEKDKNNTALFEKRLVYFAEFDELKQIITNNWNSFSPIFHNQNRFEVLFNEMVSFQAILNQGKQLTSGQMELASGITKDLKNAYTIYNNLRKNKNDYFIEIVSVSDNMGTLWENSDNNSVKAPLLRVNDDYELLIEANDPKDREIEYELYHFTGNFRTRQKSNRFKFKIEDSLIGKNTVLVIKASTPKTEYKNEAVFKIQLSVIPN